MAMGKRKRHAKQASMWVVLPEAPPDHSTISRAHRLIDLETHEAVFTWMLQRLGDAGLVKGEDGRHRRDDAGSECGAPQHRAARHRRDLPGLLDEAGTGVGDGAQMEPTLRLVCGIMSLRPAAHC